LAETARNYELQRATGVRHLLSNVSACPKIPTVIDDIRLSRRDSLLAA
jgi:hypothetical protein